MLVGPSWGQLACRNLLVCDGVQTRICKCVRWTDCSLRRPTAVAVFQTCLNSSDVNLVMCAVYQLDMNATVTNSQWERGAGAPEIASDGDDNRKQQLPAERIFSKRLHVFTHTRFFFLVFLSAQRAAHMIGWPYFDFQKRGHSARPRDSLLKLYSQFTQRCLIILIYLKFICMDRKFSYITK